MILNFIHHSNVLEKEIPEVLWYFFNPETLVLNDTRLLIIPEVIPHIPFVGGYDQRILPILSNTHVVFSEPTNNGTLEYFQKLGLSQWVNILGIQNNPDISLTENILNTPDFLKTLREKSFKKIINFSIDARVEKLAKEIGAECIVSSEISEKANNKLLLKQYLIETWLPTVEGIFTNNKDIITQYFHKKEHYFFKSPQGVSGYGFWSNQKNTLDEILHGYNWKELIIEQVIEKESSPSIQFCIYWAEKKAIIFGFTDQILEGGQHYLGNKSPSIYFSTDKEITEECLRQSESIIQYIIQTWYVGFWGIDFMISTDKKVYATEVNARFTGATYPAMSSFLLTNSLSTSWKYITHEGIASTYQEYINISIKEKWEYGLFPLCIAPLEEYGRIQVLTIWELDEHDV